MNYEHEMLESIAMAIESAKERQPIRADIYLAHLDYYQKKIEQNRYIIEEFLTIRDEIHILKNSCLEVLLKISQERGAK